LTGRLIPEPPVDPDNFDENVRDDEVEWVAERLVRRVPQLAAAEVARGWASLYDVSPDWQPVIGEIAPGIFVDAGTSGHGFKLAPALGLEVARLVLGEPADPSLADFHPSRFDEGRELDAGYGEAHILG
jgi:glycine/D-amino acid oxidase-like deaminating enzyme